MENDVEERLSFTETTVLQMSAENVARDLVLKTLISLHPDRELAASALSGILEDTIQRMRDIGFDKGYKASTAKATIEAIRKATNDWIRVFRP